MRFGFPELAAIRLGYGLSPHMDPPQTVDEVLASLRAAAPGPEAVSVDDARAAWKKRAELSEARDTGGEAAERAFADQARELRRMNWYDLQRRMARAVDAPAGFGERLVQFWADHFTVRSDFAPHQPLVLSFTDMAIRPYLVRPFEEMLFAAITHPIMLIYLDQNRSIGPRSVFARRRPERRGEFGINENLARELLELHTIGVGAAYTQRDVRELAQLLTGLTYQPENPEIFRPQRAEAGAETVLGRSYGGGRHPSIEDIRAVLTDLARMPETARHVSRKLAVHFFSDAPDEAAVARLAGVWQETGGDLAQVCRALVADPALADSFREKIRQPFDYMAAGLRALGLTGAQIMAWDQRQIMRVLIGPIQRMGQRWGAPLGPNGWPEEATAWITPQALAARINWSMSIPHLALDRLPDPRELLETALADTRSETLDRAVPGAETRREGIALILASNDFIRR